MDDKAAWSIPKLEANIIGRDEQLRELGSKHRDYAYLLSDASEFWLYKYRKTDDEADLEMAIQVASRAVDVMLPDDPDPVVIWSTLNRLLYTKYELKGSEGVLDECLSLSSRELESPKLNEQQRILVKYNLNIRALEKMRFLDDTVLIEETSQRAQELLEQCKSMPSTPLEIERLQLGRMNSRCEWARVNNRWTDFDEELRRSSVEVEACDPTKLGYPTYINDLLARYIDRYVQTRLSEYLEDAQRLSKKAIDTVPSEHQYRGHIATTRAIVFYHTSEKNRETDPDGSLINLDSAILLLRAVIDEVSDAPWLWTKIQYINVLDNLGAWLGLRVKLTGEVSTGIEAVAILNQALDIVKPGDKQRPSLLQNLVATYDGLYGAVKGRDKTQARQYLESAIRVGTDGVETGDPQDFRHAERLLNLAAMQAKLYEETLKEEDFQSAKASWLLAARTESALPVVRVNASLKAGQACLADEDYETAYLVLEPAVNLLPKVATRAMPAADQQNLLAMGSGIAGLAAAAALSAGRSAYEALGALEQGRCIIVGLSINLKDDVAALMDTDSKLSRQWDDLRRAMTREPKADELKDMTNAQRLEQIDHELRETESEIRKVPGFENFQLPLSRQACMDLATEGPIVTFNVTRYRSDAIIVMAKDILHIQIPDLTYDDLEKKVMMLRESGFGERQRNLVPRRPAAKRENISSILMWLWRTAVEPVLDATELTASRRIWWVTNGLMSLAPIHAAGDHSKGSTANTLYRAVSSYVSSLKALSYARKLVPSIALTGKTLLVTMESTPGHQPLNVKAEESVLRTIFGEKLQVLPQPSCAEVLEAMPGKSIVHLACHGYISAKLPSSSGLMLKSGTTTEILPVSRIERISIPHAEIAYLSACSTAELSLGKHIDEAINLVNCFQVLGYRHVVGTIWSASDKSAGRVASAFYTNISKDTYREYNRLKVAQALHDAVLEYAAECEDEDGPLHWGPYIHVGT